MKPERIILGIDPGTNIMGYGLIIVKNNKPELLAMGVLQLNKFEDHYMILQRSFDRVVSLIDQ